MGLRVTAGGTMAGTLRASAGNRTTRIKSIQGGVTLVTGGAGASSSSTVTKTAATAISGHKIVFVAFDGVREASNAELTHAGIAVGLTTQAAAANASIIIQTQGELTEPSWSWTVASPVFLGVDGALTQTQPMFPAKFIQVVGIATAPNTLFIDLKPPVILG